MPNNIAVIRKGKAFINFIVVLWYILIDRYYKLAIDEGQVFAWSIKMFNLKGEQKFIN